MSDADNGAVPPAAAADAAAAAGRKKRVRKPKASAVDKPGAVKLEVDADGEAEGANDAAESAVPSAAAAEQPDVGVEQPRKKRMRKPKASATESTDADAAAPMDTSDASAAAAGTGYLSVETLNYYRGLADVLERNEFQDDDDRQLFLENAMDELCGGESGKLRASGTSGSSADVALAENSHNPAFVLQRLCSHAKCSHLVQKLLSVATPPQVGMFFTALKGRVVDVLADRYGSHVLESVLFRLPALLAAEDAAAREAKEAADASATGAAATTVQEEARRAALTARQISKMESAWRQMGTHSASSVEFTEGSAISALPLRAHFHALVAGVADNWATLAQNAHASYSLRHIVHLLQGEQHIQAAAEAADNAGHHGASKRPHPGHAAAAAASAAAASASLLSLPSYLVGLEELLPWVVQEWLAAAHEDLEAVATNASGAPVLSALARSMSVLSRAVRPQAVTSTPAANLVALLAQNQQALLAKLLRLEGADAEAWAAEPSVAAKNYVSVLLQDRAGSRLLESVFSLASGDVVSACFSAHMRGRLLTLAEHPLSNYALQHLFNAVKRSWGSKGRHLLRDAFEELSEHLGSLCGSGRQAVPLRLLDAAVRVQVKENKLFKLLSAAAQESLAQAGSGEEGSAEASSEWSSLTSNVVGGLLLSPLFKAPGAERDSISTTGSLIVQSCLLPARGLQALAVSDEPVSEDALEKVPPQQELAQTLPFTTVLNAFLALPAEFVVRLAKDAAGSRVFDAFVACPAAANVKQSLLRRFQMKWVELAVSGGPGSFVLERLFGSLAPPSLRTAIAGDLVRAEKRVLGSRSGAVLHKKLRLEHYKRHQSSWLSSADATARRAKTSALFDDLLADEDKGKGDKAVKEGKKAPPAAAAAPASATSTKKEPKSNGATAVKTEAATASATPSKQHAGKKRPAPSAAAPSAGVSSASAVQQEVDVMLATLTAEHQKTKKAKTAAAGADAKGKKKPASES